MDSTNSPLKLDLKSMSLKENVTSHLRIVIPEISLNSLQSSSESQSYSPPLVRPPGIKRGGSERMFYFPITPGRRSSFSTERRPVRREEHGTRMTYALHGSSDGTTCIRGYQGEEDARWPWVLCQDIEEV